jgi:hypothetical protein
MTTTNKITMVFKTSGEKNYTLTIAETRPEATNAEINAAMDAILAADVFRPNGLTLVSKFDSKKQQINETDAYDVP